MVIYGDTDSLMIDTKKDSLEELIKVGTEIKKMVNIKYKNLVIDIDGVFKSMLLLKKKKYAAMKLDNLNDYFTMPKDKFQERWVREMKGIDIVRRDWSEITRKIGKEILDRIL